MRRDTATSAVLQGVDSFSGPSFSLQNRLARMLWQFVWLLLFRFSPRPLYVWRVFLLRLFGARLGTGCHIYPSVQIWAPWNLAMGDQSCLASDVVCYAMAPISLGNKVVVSQGTYLCAGTHDYNDPRFQLIAKPITIEDQSWIAARAFIGPGVTVGKGAVVGACSVVTRNIPAWIVCAGNPCKPIKRRELCK